MKKLLLIGIMLLVGCGKIQNTLLKGDVTVPNHKSQNTASKQVVAFGQSNMMLMGQLTKFQSMTHDVDSVVNIAVGGTTLAFWSKPGPVYNSLIWHICNHPTSALLFWQGEADTIDPASYPTWGSRFTQLIADIRNDSGVNVPVIYVQLGPLYQNIPGWNPVKDQQASLIIPNAYMVKSDDLQVSNDGVHFTQASFDIMQARLADRYNSLGGH
jgi:hypothetical protein